MTNEVTSLIHEYSIKNTMKTLCLTECAPTAHTVFLSIDNKKKWQQHISRMKFITTFDYCDVLKCECLITNINVSMYAAMSCKMGKMLINFQAYTHPPWMA